RATLTTMVALALGASCVALGKWGAASLSGDAGGLETGLLTRIMVHYQLPPQTIAGRAAGWVLLGSLLLGILGIALLLKQSLAQFRRAEQRPVTAVKYMFFLAIIILICAFWH